MKLFLIKKMIFDMPMQRKTPLLPALLLLCMAGFAQTVAPSVAEQIASYTAEAQAFYDNGDYDNALLYYKKALELQLQTYGEKNAEVSTVYNNIGFIYHHDKGDYDSALGYYEKALAIYLEVLGENHISTATSYNNIGTLYDGKGDYDSALGYYERALAIDLQVLGESHPNTAMDYNNIGHIYSEKGDYDNALDYYEKSLAICLQVYGENHPDTATTYNNIGFVYDDKGDYESSLSYYEKALAIRLQIFGENHPDTATTYNNIGSVYNSKGDYDTALGYHEKALAIRLKVLGEKHPRTANSYNNIATVYYYKGDYDSALRYLEKSLAIDLEVFGESHTYTALRYNNIGEIYRRKGDYDSALGYLEKSLAIRLKVLGENHPDTAVSYNNIGAVYGDKGDYKTELGYYKKALAIRFEILGGNHFDTAASYNNIAWTYLKKSNKKNAIANWRKTYSAWQTSKNYATITNVLSGILFRSNVSNTAFIRETLTLATDTVERARLDMASLKEGILRRSLPVYYYGVQFEAQQKKPDRAFEHSEGLRSRGFLDQVGTEAALRLDGVTESEREEVRSLVSQIAAARTEIERQNEKTLDERDKKRAANALKNLSDAEKSLAKLDAQIGRRIPAYAQLRNPVPVSARDAQKWCGKNRAVLEYVLWNPELLDEKEAQVKSYCLVLTGKKITAVELDGSYDYAGAVNRLHERIARQARESQFEALRNELYEKLVAPVLPHVGGAKELLIVPDGSLSFLPFDILRKDSDARMLGDRYAVAFSPSVSVSVLCGGYKASQSSMLAFGGAWYDKALSEAEHRGVLSQEIPYSKPGSGWADLPGTLAEIGSLGGIFGADGFTQVVQEEAAERTVKRLSQSGVLSRYGILHFACHGYFSKSEGDQPTSLLFSEISGKFAETSGEDGYLTIPESAVLNLRADIVCLSACETALGEIKAGDGVVGLSRAFMVAGARHVGASLWEVDDTATAEFMRRMYEKVVQKGMDYVAAYQQTKAEFRKDDDFSHPVYWAAFVLYK